MLNSTSASVPGRPEIIALTGDMIVGTRAAAALAGQALVLFVLGTAPVLFGAVQAWVWPVYVAAMAGAFLLLPWAGPRAAWTPGFDAGRAAVGLFLGLTLLACLPLPPALVDWLSPERFALLSEAGAVSGAPPAAWTLSYAPLASLAWWALLLGLALLFRVLGVQLAEARFLQAVLWVLFGLAVLEALYGLLQALIPNLGVLWVTYLKAGMGDARGTYINRNHFAGFLGMLLPLLLGFGLSRVRWGERIRFRELLHSELLHQHMLMVLGLVVMGLALLFSKSRGGITGTLVGLLVFFVFLRGGARRLPRAVWWVCGLFAGLILIYGLRIGFDPIIDRFLALEQGNSRLDYWRDSLPLIAGHPFGIGLAAFKTVFPVYDTALHSESVTAVYLHNDVLQLLVEAGWAGFALLGGAFAVFMRRAFRRIRRMDAARAPRRFFLAAGAYGGLAAMTVHAFFDFNLQIPANMIYFVLLMAVVRATTRGAQDRPEGGGAALS